MGSVVLAYIPCVSVVLVVTQRIADARSDYRRDTCRITLFYPMLASTFLVIHHIVDLVGTNKLGYVSS